MAGRFLASTKPCDLTIFNRTGKARFLVVEKNPLTRDKLDGLLGWPFFRSSIFEVQAEGTNQTLKILESLPKETKGWLRARIPRKSNVLLLEIPNGRGTITVFVDTGNPAGVLLSRAKWQQWKQAHPEARFTFTGLSSGVGSTLTVSEESGATNFPLGSLVLTDVSVMQDNSFSGGSSEATLGLGALARMDFIVDCKHSVVYLRPKTTPAPSHVYNRAGVVFLLSTENLDEIAHVMQDSPAYEAGIRDGDIIMKCDGKLRTSWEESPNDIFSSRPAGTKIDLVLKRGDKSVNAIVTLRDILSPNNSGPAAQSPETPAQK